MSIVPMLYHLVQHYGSPAKAAPYVSIGERHIKNILTKEGAANKLTPKNRDTIRAAFNSVNPMPLADHHRIAREQLDELKSRPGSQELFEKIIEIDGWIQYSDPESSLIQAGNSYLSMMINFSRAGNKPAVTMRDGSSFRVKLAMRRISPAP